MGITRYNLEDFKARALQFGGARPNRFNVIVNNPVDSSGDDKFNFSCKGASLPEVAMGTIDMFFESRPIKLLGDRPPFPNWTTQVYMDEDFLIKSALERWNNAMNSHQGNEMNGPVNVSPRSYKSDATVTQTSMANNLALKQYKMIGLFPVRIGELTLDWETQNQVHILEVEFAYDYWISDTTDGQ